MGSPNPTKEELLNEIEWVNGTCQQRLHSTTGDTEAIRLFTLVQTLSRALEHVLKEEAQETPPEPEQVRPNYRLSNCCEACINSREDNRTSSLVCTLDGEYVPPRFTCDKFELDP